ncbi:MAG TPA: DUF5658 family protein [Candidatus Limnocylindrales bacterium]|nr:DUF5658 family protein [Candidatus Limnocylindrales bacterium]
MPTLTLAVLTMSAAQLLDLTTFVAMVRQVGLDAELNPLVADLVNGYGLPMAAIAKLALMAFVVALTIMLMRRTGRFERALGIAVIGVAIVAGVIGGGSNVLAMGSFALAR